MLCIAANKMQSLRSSRCLRTVKRVLHSSGAPRIMRLPDSPSTDRYETASPIVISADSGDKR